MQSLRNVKRAYGGSHLPQYLSWLLELPYKTSRRGPETAEGEHSNIATIGFAIGFTLMMALDVALG